MIGNSSKLWQIWACSFQACMMCSVFEKRHDHLWARCNRRSLTSRKVLLFIHSAEIRCCKNMVTQINEHVICFNLMHFYKLRQTNHLLIVQFSDVASFWANFLLYLTWENLRRLHSMPKHSFTSLLSPSPLFNWFYTIYPTILTWLEQVVVLLLEGSSVQYLL